jgi:hypothetical protein
MSISPVAATGLESLAADPAGDARATGFDLLLADAAAPEARADEPRADEPRTDDASPDDERAGDPVGPETHPTKPGAADKTPKGPTADDTASALALVAPATAVTPAPTPAPLVPAPGNPNDAAADGPDVPVVIVPSPVVGTPPPSDPIDATRPDSDPPPAGPPVTDVPAIDLAGVLETVLDSTGPSAPVTPTPASAANLTDLIAPDTTVATTTPSTPTDAPALATADHIRLLTASTPARAAANNNSLEATSPTPPAPAPAANTAIAEAVTTTPAATPPPAAEQVVAVLKPLHAAPNGSYTLHLELKPPELGRIELRVEMRDGVMHASIHSDREGSAQMLRDALSDLRERLDGAGVRSGSLTVSDGGVGARDRDATFAHGRPGAAGRDDLPNTGDNPPASDRAGVDPETEATSLLDVRV